MNLFKIFKKSSRQKKSKNNRYTKRNRGGNKKILENFKGTPNKALLILTGSLLLFGILMMFSASNYASIQDTENPFTIFIAHIQFVIVGIILGFGAYLIPLDLLKKISPIILFIGIGFLAYMLPEALFGNTYVDDNGEAVTEGVQMPFVIARNGATRWIDLQAFEMQPSEIVKLGFVIYIAAWLTKSVNLSKEKMDKLNAHIKNVVFPFLILLGIVSMLVLAQRDFDTTVILAGTILIIYFVSGTDYIHTLGSVLIIISVVLFGAFALFLEDYRAQRVTSSFDILINGRPTSTEAARDASFQLYNGLVGFGSGGFFGNGYYESRTTTGYVQEASYTDQIFIIVGDEFGFIGSVLTILAFLLFVSIGFRIAQEQTDKFKSLLAFGLTTLISLQAFLNMAAVMALVPFGGMPLPFFTYGGSSTIINLIIVGILLNVSKKKL